MSIQREAWYRESSDREIQEALRRVIRDPLDTESFRHLVKQLDRSGTTLSPEDTRQLYEALLSTTVTFRKIADDPPGLLGIKGEDGLTRMFRGYYRLFLDTFIIQLVFGKSQPDYDPEKLRELVPAHEEWVTEGLPQVEKALQNKREEWFRLNGHRKSQMHEIIQDAERMARELPDELAPGTGEGLAYSPSAEMDLHSKLQDVWDRAKWVLEKMEDPTQPPSAWVEELHWVPQYHETAKKLFERYRSQG